MAGGFSLATDLLPELEATLLAAYAKVEKSEVAPSIIIDAALSLDEITEETCQIVESLAPYGAGNPKPIFLFSNIEVEKVKTFGNGGIHLELQFKNSAGRVINAIGFFSCSPLLAGEVFHSTDSHNFHEVALEVGRRIDLAATIEKSYFKNRPEIRLRIVDIRKPE